MSISESLQKRLAKNRPMTSITVRVPVDVVESMKAIAPKLGLAGYQTLLKSYLSEGLRRDDLLLRLPRIGALLRVLESARLSRSLAILAGSGVPLLEALQVATATLANRRIRLALEKVGSDVQGGVSLHRALDASGQFPPMLLNMVASGEASGTLPDMLERVADNQERGFARHVDTLMALFEPLMILVMGAVVLFIVLAVLLPIMQLNQGLTL